MLLICIFPYLKNSLSNLSTFPTSNASILKSFEFLTRACIQNHEKEIYLSNNRSESNA